MTNDTPVRIDLKWPPGCSLPVRRPAIDDQPLQAQGQDARLGAPATPGSLAAQYNADAGGKDPIGFFHPCGFLY